MFTACYLLVALGYRYGIERLKSDHLPRPVAGWPVQCSTGDVTERESCESDHLATRGSLEVNLFQILQRLHNVTNRT